jgi:hypothetical protein
VFVSFHILSHHLTIAPASRGHLSLGNATLLIWHCMMVGASRRVVATNAYVRVRRLMID